MSLRLLWHMSIESSYSSSNIANGFCRLDIIKNKFLSLLFQAYPKGFAVLECTCGCTTSADPPPIRGGVAPSFHLIHRFCFEKTFCFFLLSPPPPPRDREVSAGSSSSSESTSFLPFFQKASFTPTARSWSSLDHSWKLKRNVSAVIFDVRTVVYLPGPMHDVP